MAQQIRTSEATTHFYRIIKKAEQGEDFIVTRYGKPVARIVPFLSEPERTLKKTKKVAWARSSLQGAERRDEKN